MMDMSVEAVGDRLRRVYACTSLTEVCKVYGVRDWDSAAWHRERDENILARAYLALQGPLAKLVAAVRDNVELDESSADGHVDRQVRSILRTAIVGVERLTARAAGG
jgi:hypothetical protein